MPAEPYLSIIIPVYNEEKRLKNLVDIFRYIKHKKFKTEIIFVNDGSKDTTLPKLKKLAGKEQVKIISYTRNRGKGYAIRKGMLQATGLYRLFMDVDLSTPITELDKFLTYLSRYDIVIGSRKRPGAKVMVHQSPLRENLGKVFTSVSNLTLGLSHTDFTCGFKCFSEPAAKELFTLQKIDRWGFDSEVLYLAKKRGYRIKEIPVIWRNDPTTRVRLWKDICRSIFDLVRIKLFDLAKKY